ncbi:MAG: hypothetical protein G01um101419_11 [Parcubacteria group bacterium Gr01-1014_19]|nr:MAG: hypothetical protein G01um101419_11 [Parcubacteria group bacterium Gr01-1014_19]
MPEKSNSKKKTILAVIVLAVIAVVLLLGYYLWQNGGPNWKVPTILTKAPYQAVFLTNGQVYFGRASNLNANYVNLRDVYYLQVSQVLQPVDGRKEPQPQTAVNLAKLGISELHKPKDEMKINRAQVMFIEDLDDESQVVKAIEAYQESQKES